MDDCFMRIGEIADFFGLSHKAIRLYEKKGIIKPAKIDEATGYRYYTADQVKQLNALIELKSLGFSLIEIKELLSGVMNAEKFIEALREKRQDWQEEMQIAEYKMDVIDSISQRLEFSNDAKKMQELTEEERAWLLVKMVCVEDIKTQHILSEAIWL